MKRRKAIKYVGSALTTVSIIFIAYKIYAFRSDLQIQVNCEIVGAVFVTMLIEVFSIAGNANCYYALLQKISKTDIDKGMALSIYGKSNLLKYIPGNIMQFVGKNQMAMESSVRHREVIAATAIEVGCCCMSSLVVSGTFAFQFVKAWFCDNITISWRVILVLMFSMLLVAVTYAIRQVRNRNFQIELHVFISCIPIMLFMICFEMMCSIMFGGNYIWILRELSMRKFENITIISLIGGYTFSWLIGFITPGAPGGVGVREAVVMLLVGNIISQSEAGSAAVLSRLGCICGDVIAFIVLNLSTRSK